VLFEVSGQEHGFEGSAWRYQARKWQQVLIHRLHIEQIMQDAVIDLHGTCEEADVLVVCIGQIRHETVAHERCVGEQPGSSVHFLRQGTTEQAQDEVYTGSLARHVILQIGLELFVLQV
jgi:hypothetical protein